jgi:serine/threonine-protein kinase
LARDERLITGDFAAIAYETLGGRPPFTGDMTQVIAQKLTQTPRPLSTLRSDIPAAVERALMRGLAIDKQDRPTTPLAWFKPLDEAIGNQSPQEVA